ncbi:MAG TPA: transcription elongation factor GreA [Actinomycetota bacterium]|nr:transcription elongation factor GreA [Actinomycetota bacterium]
MPAQQEQAPILTPAAFERLKAEHDHLTTTGRKEVAARLLRARELGDLSENAEYHATKEEQGLMEARIRRLGWMIKNAIVTEAHQAGDEVQPGVLVTVRATDADDDDEDTYLIAASPEERAKGARTITPRSPLGAVLVGRRAGDKVSYEAPGGSFTYEIVSIRTWDGS